MPVPTFNPVIPPSPGTSDSPEVRLRRAEFGDGYTQTTRDGINHIRRKLSLRWDTLSPTHAKTILAFFESRGGDLPFFYTPSDETVAIKWTCPKWSHRKGNSGLWSISAELEQDFNPGS